MNSLQNKLNQLNAQLKVTRGNRHKAKLVIKILAVESALEKLNKTVGVKPPIEERKFSKRGDKKTIKMYQDRLSGASIKMSENAVIIKAGSLELSVRTSIELPQKGQRSLLKHLKENQTSKVHALCEVIGTLLLAS